MANFELDNIIFKRNWRNNGSPMSIEEKIVVFFFNYSFTLKNGHSILSLG
ncbi:hypothetical protein ASZ90_007746 [hydrocarbon metagenome]|uniref:Uncharacterized protein n=1 Tax=hydrocarbon metagenome TaxID=938273 RepID=A0A0W8FNG5_9ZZZZ